MAGQWGDDEHLKLQEAFDAWPGQWVAINRRTGHVVAVKSSPYELAAYLKQERVTGVDMLRAPALEEPEVVGFG